MDEATIADLEKAHATGIECCCLNSSCRHWVGHHFDLIRKTHPGPDLGALTLSELAGRMRCGRCGGREFEWRPHRQVDAQAYARSH